MSTKNFFFLGLFAIAVVGFAACAADKDCGLHGVADTDGKTCICDDGYEYDADGVCNVVTEHKFVATWDVTDKCGTFAAINYPVVAEHGSTDTDLKVSLNGFGGTSAQGGFLNPVIADVVGTSFTVVRQNPDGLEYVENTAGVVIDSVRYLVSATGTIDATKTPNEIAVDYWYIRTSHNFVPRDSVSCKATYKKK